MKRPIGLWVLGIGGIIIDILSGALFFMMLIMPAQAFFLNQFIVVALLLLLFVSSIIGLFRLKRWGRNIFLVITLIMSFSTVILLSKLNIFYSINTIFLIFILSFIIYFLHPAVRKLFK